MFWILVTKDFEKGNQNALVKTKRGSLGIAAAVQINVTVGPPLLGCWQA